MKKSAYVLFAIAGAALLCLSWQRLLPIPLTETLGFLSGVVCVWLIVEENVWNWPVGIANNAFYVIVFWRACLFADMLLQFVYIVLGCLGLYRWLYGGKESDELQISRISPKTGAYAGIFAVAAISAATIYLRRVQDAAPFLDACTAVLSICGQYLYKSLALTALLYFIFLTMCITGLVQWKRTLRALQTAQSA